MASLSSRLKLHGCEAVGEAPLVLGQVRVRGSGRVRIGHRVRIDGRQMPVELYAHQGAELRLGDDVRLGPGASLVSASLVHVGNRVEFGSLTKVLDSNYHRARGDRRERPAPMPVVVEDDAVIGERAILLPGARVAAGQRVAPGGVVSRRGPPAALGSRPAGAGHRSGPLAVSASRIALLAYVLHGWQVFGRAALGKLVFVGWPVRVGASGAVTLGSRVTFKGGIIPTEVTVRPGAALHIGQRTCIGYGCTLDAANSVHLGARCLLGSLVRICDHDQGGPRPISIGDDVWLAHGAVIAPGVSIGDGAVVGAGSLVTRDVPPESFAAGNPARAIPLRLLGNEEPRVNARSRAQVQALAQEGLRVHAALSLARDLVAQILESISPSRPA